MADSALTPVAMPQMGESLAEGTVVRWLKAVGDAVAVDEPLFEISTDKVDTDVPSPVAGVLREIVVAEGETVAVGATVARVSAAAAGEAGKAGKGEAGEAGEAGGAGGDADAGGGHFKSTHEPTLVSFRSRDRGPGLAEAPPSAGDAARARPTPAPAPVSRDRSYSPAVLEAARQGGVPLGTLTTLPGSGRGGRLTKRDVERFLREGGLAAGGPGVSQAGAPAEPSVPPEFVYRPTPDDERVPMSPVRRSIARHMSWSTRISPHATAFAEVDMSTAASTIGERRESFAHETGAPLTYTVIVAKAAVGALAEFRILNASVVDAAVILKPSVNLGVAVALADTDELIVPVVRDADGLTIAGLARAIDDLARRARERKLRPEDVQGGTFTLTNPGMFGGIGGTPIINQPQVAILGLGTVAKRPVVVDDAIAIRPVMTMSLTFDHRAADGMAAFRYLDAVRRRLEAGPGETEW